MVGRWTFGEVPFQIQSPGLLTRVTLAVSLLYGLFRELLGHGLSMSNLPHLCRYVSKSSAS